MIINCLKLFRRFSSGADKVEKMKYLCVAEKNDAAKTISGILSRGGSQRVSLCKVVATELKVTSFLVILSAKDSRNSTKSTNLEWSTGVNNQTSSSHLFPATC